MQPIILANAAGGEAYSIPIFFLLIAVIVALVFGIKRMREFRLEKKFMSDSKLQPTAHMCPKCDSAYVPGRDAFCVSCGQKIE